MPVQTLIAICAILAALAALAAVFLLARHLHLAQQQVAISDRLMRESLRPVLLCTSVVALDDTRRMATLANQSSGIALNISWTEDSQPADSDPQETPPGSRINGPSLVLGPGGEMQITFSAARTTRLVFLYTSVFGDPARTEVLLIADLWSTRYYTEPAKLLGKS